MVLFNEHYVWYNEHASFAISAPHWGCRFLSSMKLAEWETIMAGGIRQMFHAEQFI